MKVAPSLLSGNFLRLEDDIRMVNESDASYMHLDIMDGIFVPNISFGFPVIEAVAKKTTKPMDVHLMIVEPQKWISQIRDTGARIMNVHQEACLHLHRTVQAIHDAGMQAGVTICPATPVASLVDIIEDVDLVLIMSVNPGFGGQPFIRHSLEKVKELRRLIDSTGSKAMIEVDGGVNLETGRELAAAGADILVAGSYVFKAENPKETIRKLAEL